MNRFEIILYWSDEDQAFIAEVPELAGCAADGATRQEALANAEVVISEWLETARELGRPIPEADFCSPELYIRGTCPSLRAEDINAALGYAAELARECTIELPLGLSA